MRYQNMQCVQRTHVYIADFAVVMPIPCMKTRGWCMRTYNESSDAYSDTLVPYPENGF